MRNNIIKYLKTEVRNRAENKNNKFGIGVLYHIEAVVRNAEILANKYNEEQIIADADAISHFDSIPSLLYLAYRERNMNIEEGKNFVKSKLERSYRKLSDESKIFYKEKFESVMKIL